MNEIIKKALLEKKKGVYPLIIKTYYKKIKELKTEFFLEWLSKEINVKLKEINKGSFSTALYSYQKKLKSGKILLDEDLKKSTGPNTETEKDNEVNKEKKEYKFKDESSVRKKDNYGTFY